MEGLGEQLKQAEEEKKELANQLKNVQFVEKTLRSRC